MIKFPIFKGDETLSTLRWSVALQWEMFKMVMRTILVIGYMSANDISSIQKLDDIQQALEKMIEESET